MNKKVWIGFVAVAITFIILDYIVHAMILRSAYEATQQFWRSPGEEKMGLAIFTTLVASFFFAFIFSKGYEGKGLGEGLRYGFYMGMFMMVPMAYGTYSYMPIPYSLALQWFLFGMAQFLIAGVVLSMVFGMKPKAGAPAA